MKQIRRLAGGLIDRNTPLSFEFNGKRFEGFIDVDFHVFRAMALCMLYIVSASNDEQTCVEYYTKY